MRPGCLAGSAASGTTGSTTSLASEGEVVTMFMMMMLTTMTVDVQVFNLANVFKALIVFSPGEPCWPSERAGDHIIVSFPKVTKSLSLALILF